MMCMGVSAGKIGIIVVLMHALSSPVHSHKNDQINTSSTVERENVTSYSLVNSTTLNESSIIKVIKQIDSNESKKQDGEAAGKNDTVLTNTLNQYSKASYSKTQEAGAACPHVNDMWADGMVVKCYCKGNEVFEGGKCIPFHDVVVPVRPRVSLYYSKLESIDKYNVMVRNVDCDPNKYFIQNFTEEQFFLRPKGGDIEPDIILLEAAGKWKHLRLNNYCIIHHLIDRQYLTWTLKACIPIPSVPRCCPSGYVMKNGECQAAKSPVPFKPPIVIKPYAYAKDAVDFEVINYTSNFLRCESDPMVSLPIWNNGSYLRVSGQGVRFIWIPNEIGLRHREYLCPDYCVDGIEHSDGKVEYSVNFCYTNPEEIHAKTCQKGPCIRKCCENGFSYNIDKEECLEDSNNTFNLLNITDTTSYNVLNGHPFCWHPTKPTVVTEDIIVDDEGELVLDGGNYLARAYCVDEFHNNNHRVPGALVCQDEPSTWKLTASSVYSTGYAISMIFLTLIIALHICVPKLMNHGGEYQLYHAIALLIACGSTFPRRAFRSYVRRRSLLCISVAFGVQFGFLATFFWLSVMCFEIWRKIRKLVEFQEAKTYPKIFVMLYGWGIPLFICLITALMEFVEPHRIGNEIRPYFRSTCWFPKNTDGFWVYYAGPIAALNLINVVLITHTFINNRKILRYSKELSRDLNRLGTTTRDNSNYVEDFHQQFKLFALTVFCWATRVLSWKIPPKELWAPTNTFNTFQGLFIFIILLTNPNKRKLLEAKFPYPFRLTRKVCRILCICKKERRKDSSQGCSMTSIIQDSSQSANQSNSQ